MLHQSRENCYNFDEKAWSEVRFQFLLECATEIEVFSSHPIKYHTFNDFVKTHQYHAGNRSASPHISKSIHLLRVGSIEPIYVSSFELSRFSDQIKEVAVNGYSAYLNSEFKEECSGLLARRRGNGLVFITYERFSDPSSIKQTTFPTRHVDKLRRAFGFAIKSKELKEGTHCKT